MPEEGNSSNRCNTTNRSLEEKEWIHAIELSHNGCRVVGSSDMWRIVNGDGLQYDGWFAMSRICDGNETSNPT